MLKLLQYATVIGAAAAQGCKGDCLDIHMYDFYGDGWDGAELFMENPNGTVVSDAPDCDNPHVYRELCGDDAGLYTMMAIHPTEDYIPDNYWEMMWTVEYMNCNNETVKYTGGYNTTMIYDYDDEGVWTLVHWENLWENEKACDHPCGDTGRCKPKKPKAKKKKKAVVKNEKTYSKWNTTTTSTTTTGNDTSSGNMTSSNYTKQGKRYGPPAVNVRVTMFDEEGDGWWQNDYLGTSWYIADDERKMLFHTGTLCHWYKGYCNVCLGDGAYTIRFTGLNKVNASNFTAWDFCGVTGGYSMELNFHIYKGKCIPDALTTLETTCYGTVSSTVTLVGVLALGGMPSEVFNMADSQVLTRTIGRMVDTWSAQKIVIVSTSLDTVSFADQSSRKLSSFTHDVTFKVQFEAESTYGIDGRDFAKVSELVEQLGEDLEETMSTGAFQVALSNRASLAGVVPLSQVQMVELLSLEIDSISYVGVEELKAGNLPSTYSSDSYDEEESSKMDITTVVLFFAAVGFGFIAFVGIVSNRATQYNSIPMESSHDAPRQTDASVQISRTDMDTTITNPLGGNAAQGVDTGAVSSTL
mmetsp:Transcript_15240/g.33305  ORF Transcript_15240/g.33305 Transcript_15240/m.33305 type:complete len:582 (+) Transcript_15240:18-1763(+)|eukprot:CAMPEP_0116950340 /NCGR_PEP_ID=MMETSP0467-20121206/39410_1 /TAXON_ID=283647 /ORGANISM="Mesodinium pulex, Strain SPMC105" /LENGTH=581 /DNA_ID=CAMNT_0004635065 /DNA_START=18 /DNA_END=1763 /DNA_ORIENTATION=+